MKKFGIRLPVLCALILLVGMTALATVVSNIKGPTLTDAGAQNNVTITKPNDPNAPAVFTVKQTNAVEGKQYLVVVRKGEADDPTADVASLFYMGMEKAENGEVSFSAYPKEMGNGSYCVYMSDYGANKLQKVATFDVEGVIKPDDTVKLGFIVSSNDKDITANDALAALCISVGKPQSNGQAWTEAQRIAANVDGDNNVTANDALWILQRSVGKRDANWNEVG